MRTLSCNVPRAVGRHRRGIAATIALALALGATPAPSSAQLFGAMPVVDAGAIAQLVNQLRTASRQLAVLQNNARKLGHYNVRDVRAAMAEVDLLVRRGEALAYSLVDLDAQVRRTFPGARVSTTMAVDIRRQNERTLATLQGALAATRASARLLADEIMQLQAIKGQLRGLNANNAQAVAELQGVIGVHTAEELTLLRQQLAAQANAQTVFMANQMNRDLQGVAAAERFWWGGAGRPVRRGRAEVDAVKFTP